MQMQLMRQGYNSVGVGSAERAVPLPDPMGGDEW